MHSTRLNLARPPPCDLPRGSECNLFFKAEAVSAARAPSMSAAGTQQVLCVCCSACQIAEPGDPVATKLGQERKDTVWAEYTTDPDGSRKPKGAVCQYCHAVLRVVHKAGRPGVNGSKLLHEWCLGEGPDWEGAASKGRKQGGGEGGKEDGGRRCTAAGHVTQECGRQIIRGPRVRAAPCRDAWSIG